MCSIQLSAYDDGNHGPARPTIVQFIDRSIVAFVIINSSGLPWILVMMLLLALQIFKFSMVPMAMLILLMTMVALTLTIKVVIGIMMPRIMMPMLMMVII